MGNSATIEGFKAEQSLDNFFFLLMFAENNLCEQSHLYPFDWYVNVAISNQTFGALPMGQICIEILFLYVD